MNLETIKANSKPIATNFEYVYAEDSNKAFVKIAKDVLKHLLLNDTYSKEELDDKLSLIPRFSVQVVSNLPTENISETTVYLVPAEEDEDNLYTEYINVNGLWEILGTQKVPNVEVTKESIESALGYTPANQTDVDDIQQMVNDLGGVVDYVVTGAEKVVNKVLAVRNAYSFVSGNVSDLHTDGTGQTSISILHAGQAMNEIQKRTQLDLLAIHGDIMPNHFEDRYKTGFPYVKKCFSDVAKAIPFIQMQGNHDELSTDTTDEARQKYFAYIGANNVCTVTDWENRFRNYGYKDFESQKKRIIYLNTADVSESGVTSDTYVSASQLLWLVNTALDFSNKEDAENWTFSVYGHHCLDWYGNVSNVLKILDAYKGKTSGSITLDGVTIAYDFTNAVVKFIAYYHGHLHNFRVKRLGTNGVLDITIPNACFNRNNEYGTSSSYDDTVHNTYGDLDSNGNQRQFNKTADTVNDTAFNIIVEDMLNEKIHCFNYGSGIDREIPFVEEVVEETKYTITRNLANCTSSSSLTEIVEGGSHSETLSADSGYTMDGAMVTVTMGGDDISSSYSNEVLNIANVTGDIVISASAVKEETGGGDTPSYTNKITTSIAKDGSIYNEKGYKENYRISTSSGDESYESGMSVTGFMKVHENGDSCTIEVKDIDLTSGKSTYGWYDAGFKFKAGGYCNDAFSEADAKGVRKYTSTDSSRQYVRISGAFGENPVITIDEPIE